MSDYFKFRPIRIASVFHDLGVQEWRLEQWHRGLGPKPTSDEVRPADPDLDTGKESRE
jgi:hypothetical protein